MQPIDQDRINILSLLQQMTDLVFVMSVHPEQELRYAFLNESAIKASGLNTDAYGATFHDVVIPCEATFLLHQYTRAMKLGKPISFLMNHKDQIGESLLTPIVNSKGQCTHVMAVVRDITERYHHEQEPKLLAFHDPLTGLFNRRAFDAHLKQLIERVHESGQILGILVLDSDNLKQINNQHGHLVGDWMLRQIATRIESSVPNDALIARTDGDEFMVALPLHDQIELVIVAEKLLHHLRVPWKHEKMTFQISMSIGTAAYPIHAVEIQEVIKIAEQAIYKAKQRGGNKYWYGVDMF